MKGITHRDEIHLSYEDNIIIFELTALNFRNSQKTNTPTNCMASTTIG
ncbi:MAG: hypothetical protein H6566_19670 [Lewinellaceae bacterium]|nr:hypothetical protein [Lewinellaceae bacterium]